MLAQQIKIMTEHAQSPSVTLVISTQKTALKTKKDAITIKKLIKETESLLLNEYDKRSVWPIIANLQQLESEINYEQLQNTLVLFASADYSSSHKLIITTENNAIHIGNRFVTRQLIQETQHVTNYYMISLSHDEIHFFEFANAEFIKELTSPDFSNENVDFVANKAIEKSNAALQDNLLKEFFKQADKAFMFHYKQRPLPVILAGIERNTDLYQTVSTIGAQIIGTIAGNVNHLVVAEVGRLAFPFIIEEHQKRLVEVVQDLAAKSNNANVVSHLSDLYQAASQGILKELYLEKDYFASDSVAIDTDVTQIVTNNRDTNDLVDTVINAVILYGGQIHFMPNGSLVDYDRIIGFSYPVKD